MMRGMMAFSQTGHRSGVLLGRAHETADEAHAVGQRRGPTHRVARGPVVDVGHLDARIGERYVLDLALEELDIGGACLALVGARLRRAGFDDPSVEVTNVYD